MFLNTKVIGTYSEATGPFFRGVDIIICSTIYRLNTKKKLNGTFYYPILNPGFITLQSDLHIS